MEAVIHLSDFFREVGLANTFCFIFGILTFGFFAYYFPAKIKMEQEKVEQDQKTMDFFKEQINILTNSSAVIESLRKTVETMSRSNEKIITKISVHDATYQTNSNQMLSMIESNNDIGDKILEKDSEAQINIEHISAEIKNIKEELNKIQEHLIEIKAKIKTK